jgi:alpha-N-acetylglucosamine transferase
MSLIKLLSKRASLLSVVVITFLLVVFIMMYKVHLFEDPTPKLHNFKAKHNSEATKFLDVSAAVQPRTESGEKSLPNPKQSSKYAYITLLSGLNPDFTHRGFLYNAVIMKKALETLGSTADFIVMIGYQNDPSKGSAAQQQSLYVSDLNLLKANNIIIYELPRYLSSNKYKLNFAEMALLKVTPFSLISYEKIQYFDGDILPTRNMDCYFEIAPYTFTIGAVSPLNSGWYLLSPNQKIYDFFQQKALWRLMRDWDKEKGWGHRFPRNVFYTRGKQKEITLWDFNGADMDQGLFLYFFAYFYGNLYLIDTDLKEIYYYEKGIYSDHFLSMKQQQNEQPEDHSVLPIVKSPYSTLSSEEGLSICHGRLPTDCFIHFTGHSKPWIEENNAAQNDKKRKNPNVIRWMKALDELLLPTVNSSNIFHQKFGAPLGFFNANFPKGGYSAH